MRRRSIRTRQWRWGLLEAGANLEAQNEDGATPLHLAAYDGTLAVVTALLEAGANLEARTKDGVTPLHLAAAFNENPAVVTALLEAGANLEARNEYGATPLHLAAFNENPAVAIGAAGGGSQPGGPD